jgi:hypothetical protein
MQAQQMLLLVHKYALIYARIYASGIQALKGFMGKGILKVLAELSTVIKCLQERKNTIALLQFVPLRKKGSKL